MNFLWVRRWTIWYMFTMYNDQIRIIRLLFSVLGVEPRAAALSHILDPFIFLYIYFILKQSLVKLLSCPVWDQTCDPLASTIQSKDYRHWTQSMPRAFFNV